VSGAVYIASARPDASPSSVLVVACSNSGYIAATREFLERHLGLREGGYHLLAVPGGPQLLVLSEHLPKFAWAGHRWIRFAVEKMGVTRIVLVAHDGCLWYEDERFVPALLHRLAHGGTAAEHQRDDLRRAAEGLRGLGLPLAIEAYYVAQGADGRAEFHKEQV
jgi:catechol 2,3-dioxygenase-like lactoylglutathione lyase family enzyme